MESDTSPPGTAFGDEKAGRDLAYRIAEERHTGDGPGFKIIDMKLINDERQYRANIRSVGVIDGTHQKKSSSKPRNDISFSWRQYRPAYLYVT